MKINTHFKTCKRCKEPFKATGKRCKICNKCNKTINKKK